MSIDVISAARRRPLVTVVAIALSMPAVFAVLILGAALLTFLAPALLMAASLAMVRRVNSEAHPDDIIYKVLSFITLYIFENVLYRLDCLS
jgi:hypothetical protein